MILPIVFGVLSQGAQVALLATSAWLITRSAEQPPILYLTLAVVAVRAFALSRATFRYLERMTSHDAAFRQLAELRVTWYQALLPFAPAGLQRVARGDVLGAVSRDIDQLQDLSLRVMTPLVSSMLVTVTTVVWVTVFSPPAGAVLAGALLVTGVVAWWAESRLTMRAQEAIAPVRSQLADAILDGYQRHAVLVAFDQAEKTDQNIRSIDERLVRAERRFAAGGSVTASLVVLGSGTALVGVAGVIADIVQAGGMTGPAFALLVLLPLAVFEVLHQVLGVQAAGRGVQVAAERMASLIPSALPPEIPSEPEGEAESASSQGKSALGGRVGELELRDFQVTWPGATTPAGPPVTATLVPGDTLLISGASGSGKTSLANGLVGFLSYTGHYRLDGVEVNTLDPRILRQRVTLIEQIPHLFDTSIRHNLTFARPGIDDTGLWEVLDQVGLREWTVSRGGLDARVGERGAAVSGGQAQRIALARAFLVEAPVLILDEPTSHVDRERADSLIRDLLSAWGKRGQGGIVIIISHLPIPPDLVSHRVDLGG